MNIDLRLLRQALTARADLVITIITSFMGGGAVILSAYALSRTVSDVFLEGRSLGQVTPLLWLFLVAGLLRAVTAFLSEGFSGNAAVKIKEYFRLSLMKHIQSLGPAFTSGERSGELVSVVIQGVDALEPYFAQYLPQLVLAAVIPVSILIVVFPTDILSAVILLLTAPLLVFFMVLVGKNSEKLTRVQWRSLAKMSAFFLDTIQGLATLKALGQSANRLEKVADVSEKFRQTTMSVLRITFLSALVLELVSTISTAVVAVEIGLRLLCSNLEFSQAFFILILAPEFYQPLRMLGMRFHSGMSGISAAKRIFQILDTPAEPKVILGHPELKEAITLNTTDLDQGRSGSEFNFAGTFTIKFEQVSYRYAERNTHALQGASFDITSGISTVLAGASGSGKSTIFQLLMKFITPESGKISIDGTNLNGISTTRWRDQIAWVPQKPYLFNDTVRFNLTMGRDDLNEAQIEEAAEKARLDRIISSLPHQYETNLGERGTRLSSGQAQRVAIARAFIKQSPLVLMDEPSSHLDLEEDQYLRNVLKELAVSRTVIIIGHRLETLKGAGRIIVLDQGRVVEIGNHSSLIRLNGCYTHLLASSMEAA